MTSSSKDIETTDIETTVRAAFKEQAGHCQRLGSPFTALLCETLASGLSRGSAAGRTILDWPGDPSPLGDNVPLRVAGALHALARSGQVPELGAIYPPNPAPTQDALLQAAGLVLRDWHDVIAKYLKSAPQTNEVGRSAALLSGWLEISRQTHLPLALHELGSSAGLNLIADRFRYRFGESSWGAPEAHPLIAPSWTGSAPPVGTPLVIRSRRGCDVNPIDLRSREQRERLMAFVWADQSERLTRLGSAITTALAHPPSVDRADAAEWIERQIPVAPDTGVTRVLFHSIVWQYLLAPTRDRIARHIERVAAASRTDAPFAWLRFELAGVESAAELRLTLWPSGRERLLATAHAHGNWIHWQGQASAEIP